MGFCLQQLACLDIAHGADHAICRGDDLVCCLCQRPGTWFEFTGKEIIETGIIAGIDMARFSHVDAIMSNEPFYEGIFQGWMGALGQLACQSG
jgi:hypothetical protein